MGTIPETLQVHWPQSEIGEACAPLPERNSLEKSVGFTLFRIYEHRRDTIKFQEYQGFQFRIVSVSQKNSKNKRKLLFFEMEKNKSFQKVKYVV